MTSSITCRHRPACDGCPLFEDALEKSHSAKNQRIRRAFAPYEELAVDAPDELHLEADIGYRNRARMVVEGRQLGFFRAGSREVLPIERCLIHREELEAVLDRVRVWLRSDPGAVGIDARVGADAGVVTVVFATLDDAAREAARTLAAELPDWGVSVCQGSADGAFLSGAIEAVTEPAAPVMPAGIEAPPGAFYQVNDAILDAIHDAMRTSIDRDDLAIVDAYCGVGTHALALAGDAGAVGFDLSSEAIEAARRNAEKLGVPATFMALEDDDLSAFPWPDEPFVTVVNPARSGMVPHLVDHLADSSTRQILYLSCEPETLARDAERLRRRGFVATSIRAFDMMPRTGHVEVLLGLERRDEPELTDEAAFDAEKRLPAGISGPRFSGDADRSVWFARVVGRAPHGEPSSIEGHGSRIMVRRLRNVDDHSVVRIEMEGADTDALRARLRRWGHPVVGDTDFGIAAVNALMLRDEWLDRPLLHMSRATIDGAHRDAPVPPEMRRFLRLPDKLLQPEEAR